MGIPRFENGNLAKFMSPIKLLVIGCGPAARSNYFPFFDVISEELPFELSCLVELASEEESVTGFLQNRKIKPKRIYFVSDEHRKGTNMDPFLEKRLSSLVKRGEINYVCIVSEPKAHLPYLTWAIQSDLPVLVEKPITAPINSSCSDVGAKKIIEDYLSIQKLLVRHPQASVTVMAQRRYHDGFTFMRKYLKEFIEEFEIPISYIDAFYSDGQWNMPDEYEKENHPYKYGYGMLMHSGYHLFDQISLIFELNYSLKEKAPNRIEVFSKSFRPPDACHQIDRLGYNRLFKSIDAKKRKNSPHMGELDCYTLMQLFRNERVVTTASLNLLHNGISRRAWEAPKSDPYKGNGRMKHERQTICVGPLLSLQLHNYETQGLSETSGIFNFKNLEDDCMWNFDILIYRNSPLVGGEPFAKIEFGKIKPPGFGTSISPNQYSRFKCLKAFLKGEKSLSNFDSHLFTNYLLSLVSQGLASEYNGKRENVKGALSLVDFVGTQQTTKNITNQALSRDSSLSLLPTFG